MLDGALRRLAILTLALAVLLSLQSWLAHGSYLPVIVSAAAVIPLVLRLRSQSREKRLGERSMSFISESLARGAFPKESKVPDFPILAVLAFKTGYLPSRAALEGLIREKLLCFHRLRSLAVSGPDGWTFEPLPESSLHPSSFVTRHTPEEGVPRLRARIEQLMMSPLPKDRPLWDMHLLPNASAAESESECSYLVIRVSHTLGDGIALVKLLLGICTKSNGRPVVAEEFKRSKPRGGGTSAASPLSRTLSLLRNSAKAAGKVLTMASQPPDSESALRRGGKFAFTNKRVLVVPPPLSLAKAKEVKDKVGATVNDVLVACLGGAIREYNKAMAARGAGATAAPGDGGAGAPVSTSKGGAASSAAKAAATQVLSNMAEDAGASLKVRAFLPYAFPGRSKPLSNRWCFLSLALPTREPSPLGRLRAAVRDCTELKESPEALFQLWLNKFAAAALPRTVSSQVIQDLFHAHTLVFTNVPGPSEPLFVGGQHVLDMFCLLANVLPQLSIVSYGDQLRLTFVVDPDVVKDPQLFCQLFASELDNLLAEAPA